MPPCGEDTGTAVTLEVQYVIDWMFVWSSSQFLAQSSQIPGTSERGRDRGAPSVIPNPLWTPATPNSGRGGCKLT